MVGLIAFVASVVLVVVAAQVENSTHVPAVWLLILGSAAWAAWDSTQIHIREFKTTMAVTPIVLGLGIVVLWIVFFPWYLAVRYRIGQGTQPRKVAAAEVASDASAAVESSGSAAVFADLEQLAELRARGALTEQEFVAAKRKLLK
jgi:uncharacterized membrane protein YciS (DUF1049 family)